MRVPVGDMGKPGLNCLYACVCSLQGAIEIRIFMHIRVYSRVYRYRYAYVEGIDTIRFRRVTSQKGEDRQA